MNYAIMESLHWKNTCLLFHFPILQNPIKYIYNLFQPLYYAFFVSKGTMYYILRNEMRLITYKYYVAPFVFHHS